MTILTLAALTLAVIAFTGLILQQRALTHAGRVQYDLANHLVQANERITQLDQQLSALCNASAGAGEHVVRLEQKMLRLTERQDSVEMRAGGDRPYSQASQLVNRGADIHDLMETCGLTRGEAELLVMMQRGSA